MIERLWQHLTGKRHSTHHVIHLIFPTPPPSERRNSQPCEGYRTRTRFTCTMHQMFSSTVLLSPRIQTMKIHSFENSLQAFDQNQDKTQEDKETVIMVGKSPGGDTFVIKLHVLYMIRYQLAFSSQFLFFYYDLTCNRRYQVRPCVDI